MQRVAALQSLLEQIVGSAWANRAAHPEAGFRLAKEAEPLALELQDALALAACHRTVADYFWRIADYAAAAAALQQAFEHLEKAESQNDTLLHQFIDPSETPLFIKKIKAQLLHLRGAIAYSQSNYGEALRDFQESLLIRHTLNDLREIADTLNNIGGAYRALGDYTQAAYHATQSLSVYENINHQRGIAGALCNLGAIYFEFGDLDTALQMELRYLTLDESAQSKSEKAVILNNLAEFYLRQGDAGVALSYASESLKLQEDMRDTSGMSISLMRIGDAYLQLQRYDDASSFLLRSLEAARGINYHHQEILSLQSLSRLSEARGDIRGAIEYLYSALAAAERFEEKELAMKICESLSQALASICNFKSAFEYQVRYGALREEVISQTAIEQLAKLKARMEWDALRRKTQELEEANQKLKAALEQVKKLEEIVTICAWSGKIQMDDKWVKIEEFLEKKFGLKTSHGIAPDAESKLRQDWNLGKSAKLR